MTTLDYLSLPQDERRKAERLGQKLLLIVPDQEPLKFLSPLRVTSTPYFRPENVIAALVYGKRGKWWGDVVFRDGRGVVQAGTPDDCPLASREEGMKFVERVVAAAKAMVKPSANAFTGPKKVELIVRGEEPRILASSGRAIPRLARGYGHNSPDLLAGLLVDKVAWARRTVMKNEPDGAAGKPYIRYAAAFLVANGVSDLNWEREELCWCQVNKTGDAIKVDRRAPPSQIFFQ